MVTGVLQQDRAKTDRIDRAEEWARCLQSAVYFINSYCWIYNSEQKKWIRLILWPFQVNLVRQIYAHRKITTIKSRQIGFSWVCRGIFLHAAIFDPIANIAMFSKGDADAQKLLSEEKGMIGMYNRLPEWMKPEGRVKSNAHEFVLGNHSMVYALPYTQAEGDSYSHCLIDEIDRFPVGGAETLIGNIDPALEKATSIIYGSISDKSRPDSVHKNIFRAATKEASEFHPIFIPWNARPDRDREWYNKTLQEAVLRQGSYAAGRDWMYEQYPETVEQALSPASQNKRIPYENLEAIFVHREPITAIGAPAISGLTIFHAPDPAHSYVIGADSAEGVIGGDDSAATVLDANTGVQMAVLRGKFEPKKVFPGYLFQLARFYNDASVMVERNSHGHAVLGELTERVGADTTCKIFVLNDPHDGRLGWLSSPRGKVALYDTAAQQIKDKEVFVHDSETRDQLTDIDINTLLASKGKHDDMADAFSLACCARESRPIGFSMFRI